MIKEAIAYIVGLGKAEVFDQEGISYSDKQLHKIQPPTAEFLEVSSLSGLVDYVKSNFDTTEKFMLHVENPTEVNCLSVVNHNMKRHHWIRANAWSPEYRFDRFYDAETFNIKLQSNFVKNEDRDVMLKVVGNIKEESVNSVGDDGTSQSVVAKTGVASVGNVKVPNPVVLSPYRTFVEVKQPESEFVFRMQAGPQCALFEADGGAWKNEAIQNVKNYLEQELADLVKEEKVYIIA